MTKYIIRRTSCWDKEKPHQDAIQEEVNSYETRTCSREYLRDVLKEKDWEQYENYTHEFADCFGDPWVKVYCRRPRKETIWTIEIDNLDKFAEENGDIILFQNKDYKYRVIEIYDEYRE